MNSLPKTERFNLRATPVQNILIRRAAEMTGRNVSEFILESAYSAARNTVLDQRLFLVDEDRWRRFHEALDRPAAVKPGLKKLMEGDDPWD